MITEGKALLESRSSMRGSSGLFPIRGRWWKDEAGGSDDYTRNMKKNRREKKLAHFDIFVELRAQLPSFTFNQCIP